MRWRENRRGGNQRRLRGDAEECIEQQRRRKARKSVGSIQVARRSYIKEEAIKNNRRNT